MGNRFKLETVLLTHKTHQPLALATLIPICAPLVDTASADFLKLWSP